MADINRRSVSVKAPWAIMALIIVGVVIVFLVKSYNDLNNVLSSLSSAATARGLITLVIALTTAFIGLALTASVIFDGSNSDPAEASLLKDRFDYGKQILTLFIGILGTIVGFYYGSTGGAQPPSANLQFGTPIVTPASLTPGGAARITSNVYGGKPPYTYSITFNPAEIPAAKDVSTDSGLIVYDATVQKDAAPNIPITYLITAKDSDGNSGEFNKDGKLSLAFQPSPKLTPQGVAGAGGATTAGGTAH